MNKIVLSMTVIFILSFNCAMAQDNEMIDDVPVEVIDNGSFVVDDDYIEPSFQNLSKMYWAIGKLNIEDNEVIDNYLLINECDLYLKYYNNDFEWETVREAAREHILQSIGKINTKFELLAPIALGRYDIEKEEFMIDPDSQFLGVRKVDFNSNDFGYNYTCAKAGEIAGYPLNLIVILNRPIVLEKIPVKRDLAELYIRETEKPYEHMSRELRIKRYTRTAYLRLKIKITQYKNTVRGDSGSSRAVVFGSLDGYEIYADSQKTKPLYSIYIKSKERRRLKKSDDSSMVE